MTQNQSTETEIEHRKFLISVIKSRCRNCEFCNTASSGKRSLVKKNSHNLLPNASPQKDGVSSAKHVKCVVKNNG